MGLKNNYKKGRLGEEGYFSGDDLIGRDEIDVVDLSLNMIDYRLEKIFFTR